jgi:hypothetical protein
MATATKAEPTRQELEPKHDALLLRREGLVDLIESAPAEIAQLRELWVRSETQTSERKLQAAIRAREAAEADLVQVDANIAVVDTLLAEELAREQQKAREELAGSLGGMRDEQGTAFKACADKFAELFDAWRAFAATQEALQSAWWVSPGRDGVQPGHLLDPTPVTFQALLGLLYRAACDRYGVDFASVQRLADLVPDLGVDTPLELGGQGIQPFARF